MKEKRELKDSHVSGSLWDFLRLLEDMENKRETMRTVSGKLEGPSGSKAVYGYTVKLGIEAKDFPFRKGFHPSAKRKMR